MNVKINFFFVIALLLTITAYSQVNTVQPSITVVPWVSENQDIRTIIEERPELRVAISEVQQGFNDRGYNTKDFVMLLKGLERMEHFKKENKSELKDKIAEMAGTDIMVEVDITFVKSSSGNQARILLKGNVTDTGDNLSASTCESGKRYTEDQGALAKMAVEACIDAFLETLNEKFGLIVENGKSLIMQFDIAADSQFSMESIIPAKNDELKYVIQDWLDSSAYKNYTSYTSNESKIFVDEYKYPIRNPETNRNYRATDVERELKKYFNSINVPVSTNTERKGVIIVTIK
jgi:hypothetical protein